MQKFKTVGRSSDAGRAGVWHLILAIFVVQAGWWLFIDPVFHSSPLPPIEVVNNAAITPLGNPEFGELVNATWQNVSLPWSECCKHSYYALRTDLPVPTDDRAGDLGLIVAVGADNYWAYVNGIGIRNEGTLSPSSYHGLWQGIIRVPSALVRAENNELVVITARNGRYYTDAFRVYVGDYNELVKHTAWRRFVMGDLRLIKTIIPLLIAGVCLLLLFRVRNRPFLLAIAALALVWGLRNGFFQWEIFGYGDIARRDYYALLTNGLPLAWFFFVHSWVGASAGKNSFASKWMMLGGLLVAGWLLCSMFIIYRLLYGSVAGIEAGERVIEIYGVVVITLAIARMTWHLLLDHVSRPWEAALLILCMSTFALEMAEYFFGQFGITSTSHSAAIFLLSFVVMIIARNVRLYESIESFNQELNERLVASEAEIRDNYERLNEANEEAALSAERQRLLQDMHDGIGAQLVGMLALVRGTNKSFTMVEQGLAEMLDDLRLIIDSLDSATNDLPIALGIFRTRIEPRLRNAGIHTEWDFDNLPIDLPCAPSQTLQLYRILQESMSNALQHSNGTRLKFSASMAKGGTETTVTVSVADNGTWKEPNDERQHRGLTSMERRAQALGGVLNVDGQPSGTTVNVTFTPQQISHK